MNDITVWLGVLMVLAFAVNIIVQMTKSFIPLPTKLWCIIVSVAVDVVEKELGGKYKLIVKTFIAAVSAVVGYVVAYFIN